MKNILTNILLTGLLTISSFQVYTDMQPKEEVIKVEDTFEYQNKLTKLEIELSSVIAEIEDNRAYIQGTTLTYEQSRGWVNRLRKGIVKRCELEESILNLKLTRYK